MEFCSRGFELNHKTVQRLMTESSLKCMVLIIFAEGGKLAMVHKICWQEISLWKGRIRNE